MNNYLASSSPRRKEILSSLGLNPIVISANHAEIFSEKFSTEENCMSIAFQKAQAAIEKFNPLGLVIASDTTVVLEKHILNKPIDRDDARNMLMFMREKTHRVLSGFCLIHTLEKWKVVDMDCSYVTFKKFTMKELEHYLDSEEYADKAGAYGIQGKAVDLISSYQGSLFNIIGLPIEKMADYWPELKVRINEK